MHEKNDPVAAVAALDAGLTLTMSAGTVVDGDGVVVEVDGKRVEARSTGGGGPIIIKHDTPGTTVAEFAETVTKMVDEATVFALPRGARVEYLTAKPRRTLGAWRRKVAAPSVLLSTLLHDGRTDVLTVETLAACGVLAAQVGRAPTAADLASYGLPS